MITLLERREAAGLSQKEQAIGHYETGLRIPKVEIARKLADILGCEWWELYEDNDKESKKG